MEALVNFRETAGGSGRITKLTSIITQNGASISPAELGVDLPLAPFGIATGSYFHEFSISVPGDVRWRLSGSGTDEQGRPFTTVVAEVDVVPGQGGGVTAPGSGRIELWGGPDFDVYLGCFTCNEFDSESVFNQFGKYGSRFSSTSIWNSFSQYGSAFSNYSACNQFASRPPRLVDRAAGAYWELTINEFRPYVYRPAVPWLEGEVCE